MITYKWKIGPLEVAEQEGGKANVVKIVNWTLLATEGQRVEQISDRIGLPPGARKPFDQVTRANALAWIEGNPAINLPALKAELAARLAAPLKEPDLVSIDSSFEKDDV